MSATSTRTEEPINTLLHAIRAQGLDYRANPDSPDGPWRAQCPVCRPRSNPDEMPLTITKSGHIRCAHFCNPEQIADALDNATRAPQTPQDPAGLRFMSAAELKAYAPLQPPWIWDGYLAPGNITLFAGKPKAGKSRLACDLTAAIAGGAGTFLGRQIETGPVVYVSEEGAGTLAHKLPNLDHVSVLTRENAWPKPDWPTLVNAATTEARRIGAVLLVIDTLAHWAGMPADREKDSGAALAVMDACITAARQGLAVLLPSHTRKGGGDDGEGIRGSSAFAGSADIIIEMERVPDAPRQRALLALSRYPQTPGTLVAELAVDGIWRCVNEGADRIDTRNIAAQARTTADAEAILSAVDEKPLTRDELENATGTPARQWNNTLKTLQTDGKIRRTGAGKKGDPYRYEMLRTNPAHDAAQKVRTNANEERSFSAAHPFRDAAETTRLSTTIPNTAQCAETHQPDPTITDDDLAYYEALINPEQEAA